MVLTNVAVNAPVTVSTLQSGVIEERKQRGTLVLRYRGAKGHHTTDAVNESEILKSVLRFSLAWLPS